MGGGETRLQIRIQELVSHDAKPHPRAMKKAIFFRGGEALAIFESGL